MLAYHFTEMPYPFLPDDAEKTYGAMRVTLPSRYCDPKITHDLYNRYLDEYEYADELGLEVMLNEHHATATCMAANVSITAATLVRRHWLNLMACHLAAWAPHIASQTNAATSQVAKRRYRVKAAQPFNERQEAL